MNAAAEACVIDTSSDPSSVSRSSRLADRLLRLRVAISESPDLAFATSDSEEHPWGKNWGKGDSFDRWDNFDKL